MLRDPATLAQVAQSTFARTYTRAYTRHSPLALQHLGSWTIVQIAARMAEGITAEQPTLTALLEQAWHSKERWSSPNGPTLP